ncbi:MAG: iron-containing alcohol dehydrogenase [Ruminococcaceae bacterium]|nr:iron-containing alcohol dehydrogenase [Oscillospiraceae bacterium]
MHSFEYYSPTKIVFGKDAEQRVSEGVREFGGNRVLIVCYGDPNNSTEAKVLTRIKKNFKDNGIEYEIFDGVVPNPTLSHVVKGVKKASDFGADFFLAVGGGSVIDTAKSIAVGAANPETDIWKFFSYEEKLEKTLPVGVILTIAASGSETSGAAILTREEDQDKKGLYTDVIRPKIAYMNPELTYTLPKRQISYGIADIMMHTMDRYFTCQLGNELTDEFAEAVLRVMIKNGPIMLENPTDYSAASEIMWCGTMSHNGITGLGGLNDFAPHLLGAPLSGVYNIPHAPTLTAVWGDWAKYVFEENPSRFAQFGRNVFGDTNNYDSDIDAAKAAINITVDFFKDLGMPTCFSELGIGVISEEELQVLTSLCPESGEPTMGTFKVLDKNDIYNIFKMANR